jgi:hypothetical protein
MSLAQKRINPLLKAKNATMTATKTTSITRSDIASPKAAGYQSATIAGHASGIRKYVAERC